MDVLRQVFSVLLVFSLLGVLLWALRRTGRISFMGTQIPGHTRSIAAVERLALTPQHMLHVVRLNGREVLIATHPGGCTFVSTATERQMGAEA